MRTNKNNWKVLTSKSYLLGHAARRSEAVRPPRPRSENVKRGRQRILRSHDPSKTGVTSKQPGGLKLRVEARAKAGRRVAGHAADGDLRRRGREVVRGDLGGRKSRSAKIDVAEVDKASGFIVEAFASALKAQPVCKLSEKAENCFNYVWLFFTF